MCSAVKFPVRGSSTLCKQSAAIDGKRTAFCECHLELLRLGLTTMGPVAF
ncbi:hypothetical protein MMMDOFMJ_4432 [Methylobacterium gnaphalii]|nr:hypothetical protein MMMDOFMJ_4432 [Methylobacterium gnaphalii]